VYVRIILPLPVLSEMFLSFMLYFISHVISVLWYNLNVITSLKNFISVFHGLHLWSFSFRKSCLLNLLITFQSYTFKQCLKLLLLHLLLSLSNYFTFSKIFSKETVLYGHCVWVHYLCYPFTNSSCSIIQFKLYSDCHFFIRPVIRGRYFIQTFPHFLHSVELGYNVIKGT
jgi:hypothetical protein